MFSVFYVTLNHSEMLVSIILVDWYVHHLYFLIIPNIEQTEVSSLQSLHQTFLLLSMSKQCTSLNGSLHLRELPNESASRN